MLECLKVLPKFIQCQRTGSALVPTHFLYVYSFPSNSESSAVLRTHSVLAETGARSCLQVPVSAPIRCSPRSAALAGPQQPRLAAGKDLPVAFCCQETGFQVSNCVSAAAPTSFACYPAEPETCAACRESSLFTEETHSCTCQGSIDGYLWDYRGN